MQEDREGVLGASRWQDNNPLDLPTLETWTVRVVINPTGRITPMCGCSEHSKHAAEATAAAGAVTLKINNMTCGHCASTVSRAIESAFPGATVEPDPSSRQVSVTGVTDLDRLASVLRAAGYAPAPA